MEQRNAVRGKLIQDGLKDGSKRSMDKEKHHARTKKQ